MNDPQEDIILTREQKLLNIIKQFVEEERATNL